MQYAINQGGVLVLGPSESLPALTKGLQTISAKHKLFRCKGNMAPPLLDCKRNKVYPSTLGHPSLSGHGKPRAGVNMVSDAGMTTLLNRYAPPAILVNENHEAVHLYGSVNNYFFPKEGAASFSLNRLLPDSLTPVTSALLHKAAREHSSMISDRVAVKLPTGEQQFLRLSAHPVANEGEQRLTLLCFVAEAEAKGGEVEAVNVDPETADRVLILERELAATRESLQSTIEELETSNDEMSSVNAEF